MTENLIYIGDLLIIEPMTAITDIIAAIICFICYAKFNKKSQNTSIKYYSNFFLYMGISMLIGGLLTHAFCYLVQDQLLSNQELKLLPWSQKIQFMWHKMPCWIFNLVSVTYFLIYMSNHSKRIYGEKNSRIWLITSIIITALMFVLLFAMLDFFVTEMHIGFAILALCLPMHLKILRKEKTPYVYSNIVACVITILVALVMIFKVTFGTFFNFNDISHLLIGASMYYFFVGASQLLKQEHGNKFAK